MKIRTDFVTNSSSSGFVVVTVTLKNEWKYELYREYDEGWGGYFWANKNRNTLEKEMKQLKNGDELLALLQKSIGDFDIFMLRRGNDSEGQKFRDGVSAIADFGDVLSVFIKEETHFEGGGKPEKAKFHYINMPEEERRDKAAAWIEKYSEYIEKDPKIDFKSSISFSGVFTYAHEGEPEHPIIKEIKKRGGECRMSWVNNWTKYLIVDPEFAGDPVIEYAIQRKQKGQDIKIVLLEDAEKLLKLNKTGTAKKVAPKPREPRPESSVSFVIEDGVLVKVNGLTEYDEEIVVPDDVQEIKAEVFRGCKHIRNISLPEGLLTIGRWAFGGCSSLQDVTLPDSLRDIRNGAFSNCSKLQSITLPKGLKKLGDYVFRDCKGLKSVTLPSKLKSIKEETFYGCSDLQNVTLPDGLNTIEERVFMDCTSLESIILPNGVNEIRMHAFNGCTGLRSVTLPAELNILGTRAFANCTNLQSITLPNSLNSIGSAVFENCSLLQSVEFPIELKEIEAQAFFNCKNLQNIDFPKKLKKIDDMAFKGCDMLADSEGFIIVRNALYDYIGGDQYAKVPDAVTTISRLAFRDCDNLQRVTLPDGMKDIPEYAFYNCENLVSVEIPESVSKIAKGAFEDCPNLTIHAPAGSYAEQYAKKNKIKFEANS